MKSETRTVRGVLLAAAVVAMIGAAQAPAATVLFDDFNNSDLATGGPGSTNAGFQQVSNGVNGPTGSVTESGTVAGIVTGTSADNGHGIVSINSFDPTAASAFSVTWVVASQSLVSTVASTRFTVQSGTAFRQPLYFELRILTGGTWETRAGTGAGTLLNSGGSLGAGISDGYSITLTFDALGYSVAGTGFGTNPSFSEAWDGSFDYDDFSATTHIAATQHNQAPVGGNTNRVLNVDSILVDATPIVAIPAPAALPSGLIALTMLGLRRTRLRR